MYKEQGKIYLMDKIRNQLLDGLSMTENDPLKIIGIVVGNASKVIGNLQTELRETDKVMTKQALFIKKLSKRQADLEKDFAQIRLDLKSAHILHDEKYTPPPVDEVAKRPQRKTESKTLKNLESSDPF